MVLFLCSAFALNLCGPFLQGGCALSCQSTVYCSAPMLYPTFKEHDRVMNPHSAHRVSSKHSVRCSSHTFGPFGNLRSTLQLCWKEASSKSSKQIPRCCLATPRQLPQSRLSHSQAGDLFRLDGDMVGAVVIEEDWDSFANGF